MESFNVCEKCGTEIPADSANGRCPVCALAVGMETMGSETLLGEAIDGAQPLEADIFTEAAGKYTLIGEHARGGMGRVLLVHDESLGRDVALKELLPGKGGTDSPTPIEVQHSKEMAARFLREARITGQLEHPSITPVHELGRREDGSLYYTMKLVKGRTLEKAIQDCGTLDERLKLLPHFVDLCNAIAYAHSRHVIHRDIKPANVMVGDYGETVILDWGLAKVKDEVEESASAASDPTAATVLGMRQDTPSSGHKTAYGQLLGTPVYMSPEQAKGLPADEKSDIYSLGAVLYEILTGRPPFSGKNVEEVIAKVVYEEPDNLAAQLPQRLSALVRAANLALHKQPTERVSSAHELGNLVEGFKDEKNFINPLRPNLADLVPELRQVTSGMQTAIIREARIALKKDKMRSRKLFLSGVPWLIMLVFVTLNWSNRAMISVNESGMPARYVMVGEINVLQRTIKQLDPDIQFNYWTSETWNYQQDRMSSAYRLQKQGELLAWGMLAVSILFMLGSSYVQLNKTMAPYVREVVSRWENEGRLKQVDLVINVNPLRVIVVAGIIAGISYIIAPVILTGIVDEQYIDYYRIAAAGFAALGYLGVINLRHGRLR